MSGGADFKESPFMYMMAALIIGFVVVQSVFFIVKAWRRARKLGISKETLKSTVFSSALFTVAPAISILATVIVLASALGIVLPWIRLSVIGNLAYETVAASAMLEQFGSNINTEITDPVQFSAVAWVMTIGSSFPLVLLPILCRLIQKKIGGVVSKSDKNSKLADSLSAAAFIGIIAAFIAVAVNGKSADGSSDAGFMSIATLLSAVIIMLLTEALCRRFKLRRLELFAVPISIFGAMGIAVLLTVILPPEIAAFTWWG